MKPEKVRTSLAALPGRSYIQREPLGVVLIIGAWNYPLHLVTIPLIGALAAGNCAVVKPSDVTPKASALVAKWLPKYLDRNAFRVMEGGVPETTALLQEKWDHIFYTGNANVGRLEERVDGPTQPRHCGHRGCEILGADTLVYGHIGNADVDLTLRLPDIHHAKKGAVMGLSVPADKLHLFEIETGRRIKTGEAGMGRDSFRP